MKRFLAPAWSVAILSAGLLAYFLFRVPPFTGQLPEITLYTGRVVGFLVLLFLFATSLFSLVFYFMRRLLGDYQEPRYTYRRSLRQSALLGLGVTIAAVLLLTRTANVLTLLLAAGVLISLEFTLR